MKENPAKKRDIRPFIYGGLASITAEFGKQYKKKEIFQK